MYPGCYAETSPDKAAVISARTGEVLTYAELNARSNQLAQLLWAEGLRRGDHVAVFLENHLRYFEVFWAAFRSGLYLTTVNRYLTAPEATYIVEDCGAQVLVSSRALHEVAAEIPGNAPACRRFLVVDGLPESASGRFEAYEAAIDEFPPEPLEEEPLGEFMLYSSGTTGRPKGITRPLPNRPASRGLAMNYVLKGLFHVDEETVYLSPAPMYHSAPIGFCSSVQSLGGTVVMMDRFDPVEALQAMEKHAVTHSQWVPTMFTRMLKLPEAERAGFDLSAHRVAIHAAAPCPRKVKEQMFSWWGPILHEYYGGTELNGLTYVGPEDWLAHPGTVGRAVMGTLRICDESGEELPAGEPGLVYFERDKAPFAYHNDAEKTRSAQHPKHPGWTALGDVGYVDDDGFLFLTDRASFMIISGGVNIYPQEIENELIMHPKVEDVAVVGVPHPEFGEEVKAVVQPVAGATADEALVEELMAFAREHLAAYKCPRSIDFEAELPRLPTGKLYKRILKDRYWGNKDSRIV
ncbi:MAG: AMP-binding protein [Deltaproteobacteria bacterium]|nr:AMP-binding protein [Deltaproteobacteria bacterium]